jgi:hypothetical protein
MDRRPDWIVRNGALAAALYFALVQHVGWLPYAIAAFIWWTLAASVWAIPGAPVASRIRSITVPHAATMTFDFAVLGSMFVAHWYWTAFAYAMSRGCLALAHARTTSKP